MVTFLKAQPVEIIRTFDTTEPQSSNDFCWMGSFKYNVIYVSYDVDWTETPISINQGIAGDIKTCVDNGFNIIMLAFLQGSGGYEPVDAFIAWNKLSSSLKQETLEYAHFKGAKILLSIGGAQDHIDGSFGNENGMDMNGLIFQGAQKARDYAEVAAQAVLENGLDGLDYDFELHPGNFGPFRQDYMKMFLEETHKKTRELLPMSDGYIISHAPMGPYASVWAGENKGYVEFMLNYQDEIDFIALQYYNQGIYSSYDTTFNSVAGTWAEGSSVKELKDAGIKIEKLVVGKPVSTTAGSTGYMTPDALQGYGCRAKEDFGFVGGFMTWMYHNTKQWESAAWSTALTSLCSGDVAPSCDGSTVAPDDDDTGDNENTDDGESDDSKDESEEEVDYSCAQAWAWYAHPLDCQKYINCQNFVPVFFSCPEGQTWNQEKTYCDWAANNPICQNNTADDTEEDNSDNDDGFGDDSDEDSIDPTDPATTTMSTPEYLPPNNTDSNFCWMGSFKYNVIYVSYDVDWTESPTNIDQGIAGDIKKVVDSGFNIIMLAFLQGSNGYQPVDAFVAWNKLSPDLKQETLDYAHSNGAKILLSIGGAMDHIDGTWGNEGGMDMAGLIFQGEQAAREYAGFAAQAVLDNDLDGLDYDFELHPGNFGPFRQDYMKTFLEETHKKARELLPMSDGYIISHAPMGPYASVWAGENKGYVRLFQYVKTVEKSPAK